MKNYSRREFGRILIDNGYAVIRQDGKHCIWQKDGAPSIAIPKHKLNFMICRRLIKENDLIIR